MLRSSLGGLLQCLGQSLHHLDLRVELVVRFDDDPGRSGVRVFSIIASTASV
jgi:hypothetical protein